LWGLEIAIVSELVRLVRAGDAADDELNGVSRFALGVAAGVPVLLDETAVRWAAGAPVAPGAGFAGGDAER
jgi:hypothetical protein